MKNLKSLRFCIYPAYKCLNANVNIYEQDKFRAQLSCMKIFFSLCARPRGYKSFLFHAQLSIFIILINVKMPTMLAF